MRDISHPGGLMFNRFARTNAFSCPHFRTRVRASAGIFPTHNPKLSTTSGMPSGHSQTAVFLAVVLHAKAKPGKAGLAFLAAMAAAVLISRTKYGGPLAVAVNGPLHTLLQRPNFHRSLHV
jgi:membrane-associated phospholipid phosphatase